MTYTDENVPVNCPECNAWMDGFDETLWHINNHHPDYKQPEKYARIWTEEAHTKREQEASDE